MWTDCKSGCIFWCQCGTVIPINVFEPEPNADEIKVPNIIVVNARSIQVSTPC